MVTRVPVLTIMTTILHNYKIHDNNKMQVQDAEFNMYHTILIKQIKSFAATFGVMTFVERIPTDKSEYEPLIEHIFEVISKPFSRILDTLSLKTPRGNRSEALLDLFRFWLSIMEECTHPQQLNNIRVRLQQPIYNELKEMCDRESQYDVIRLNELLTNYNFLRSAQSHKLVIQRAKAELEEFKKEVEYIVKRIGALRDKIKSIDQSLLSDIQTHQQQLQKLFENISKKIKDKDYGKYLFPFTYYTTFGFDNTRETCQYFINIWNKCYTPNDIETIVNVYPTLIIDYFKSLGTLYTNDRIQKIIVTYHTDKRIKPFIDRYINLSVEKKQDIQTFSENVVKQATILNDIIEQYKTNVTDANRDKLVKHIGNMIYLLQTAHQSRLFVFHIPQHRQVELNAFLPTHSLCLEKRDYEFLRYRIQEFIMFCIEHATNLFITYNQQFKQVRRFKPRALLTF